MNNSVLHSHVRRTKGETLTIFIICTAAVTLLGWLCALLSGAVSGSSPVKIPADPGKVLSAIIWTMMAVLLGSVLFLTVTAEANTRLYQALKITSGALWAAGALMLFILPFFTYSISNYTLSFVWLAVINSVFTALTIINFKLRPACGFLLLPFLAWLAVNTYAILYIVLNV